MKHGIASENAVEINSLQTYFCFSCKVYKTYYTWLAKPICFVTPKLHFTTPNGVVTHSLRNPDLDSALHLHVYACMFIYAATMHLLSTWRFAPSVNAVTLMAFKFLLSDFDEQMLFKNSYTV